MSKVVEVTDQTFEEEVLKSDVPTEVDFWAPWCGPCRMVSPIYDKLAEEYDSNKFKFCKINVDENRRTARQYQIMSIPAQMFFVNGEKVDELLGAVPEQTIRSKVDEVLHRFQTDEKGRLNWRKIESLFVLTLALAALTASLISGCCSQDESGGGGGPQVGKPAPKFVLPSLDGENVSLSDFRGKVVLVNFWESSCGYCRMEMPYLNSAFKGYSGEVVVLAVNVGEAPSTVKDFVQSRELSFPVLLDARGTAASKYQIRAFPTTFLIDRQGVIQDVKFGAFQSAASVAKEIDKLID